MEVKEILETICATYDKGNKAAFARRLGISSQTLHGWLQRGRIEYDTIFRACPDINMEWLLTNGAVGSIQDPNIKETEMELQTLRTENRLLREIVGAKKPKN